MENRIELWQLRQRQGMDLWMKEKYTEKQEEVRQKIMDWSDEMKNYQLSLINENPNYFFSKVLKSMIEPEIPEAPKDENGNIKNRTVRGKPYETSYCKVHCAGTAAVIAFFSIRISF